MRHAMICRTEISITIVDIAWSAIKIFANLHQKPYRKMNLTGYPIEPGVEDYLLGISKEERVSLKIGCSRLTKAMKDEVSYFENDSEKSFKLLNEENPALAKTVTYCKTVVKVVSSTSANMMK